MNLFFSNDSSNETINQFYLYDKYASIYYAYNAIHRYMVRKNKKLFFLFFELMYNLVKVKISCNNNISFNTND